MHLIKYVLCCFVLPLWTGTRRNKGEPKVHHFSGAHVTWDINIISFTHSNSGTPTGTGSKPALSNMLHVTWPRQFVQTMTFVFKAINYHPEPYREGLERRQRVSQSHSHLRC